MYDNSSGASSSGHRGRVYLNVSGNPAGEVDVDDTQLRESMCREAMTSMIQTSMSSGMPHPDAVVAHMTASIIMLESVMRMLRRHSDEARVSETPLDPSERAQARDLLEHFESAAGMLTVALEFMRGATELSIVALAGGHDGGKPYLIEYWPSEQGLLSILKEAERHREMMMQDPSISLAREQFKKDGVNE
jgi:hypothetical protein